MWSFWESIVIAADPAKYILKHPESGLLPGFYFWK